MKPLHDYITVELIPEEDGAIITLNKPVSPKGRVTGVGDKVKDIKVGDIVYYVSREGIEHEGQEFIRADEVIGIYA
jgi:hypothetical protein